ncbi:Phosphatidylethanolamine-binding protein 1, partial [Coemansia sp. RSA 2610]
YPQEYPLQSESLAYPPNTASYATPYNSPYSSPYEHKPATCNGPKPTFYEEHTSYEHRNPHNDNASELSTYEHDHDYQPHYDEYEKHEHGCNHEHEPHYDEYDKHKNEYNPHYETYDAPAYKSQPHEDAYEKHEHGCNHEHEPHYNEYDKHKNEYNPHYETYNAPAYKSQPHETIYKKPDYKPSPHHDEDHVENFQPADSSNEKYAENDYKQPEHAYPESDPTETVTVTDTPSAPALPVGPDPNNPLAPYLLPTDSSSIYQPYGSATRKQAAMDGVRSELKDALIIPDVLPESFTPEFDVTIRFDGEAIEMGQRLSINETKTEPIVEFDAPPGQVFTVAIVDPDAPSNERHGYRSYRHFLMTNLGSYDDYEGEKLTAYRGPQPSFGSGVHRYAVIVFRQKEYVEITEKDIPHSRVRFDAVKWGADHHMKPVAASYFTVKRKRIVEIV